MTHNPEIRYTTAADGRITAQCVVCHDASQPTAHRPNAQAWAKEHVKEARG